MNINILILKPLHKLALGISALILLVLLILYFIFYFNLPRNIEPLQFALFIIIFFVLTFVILINSLKYFFQKQIEKIYKSSFFTNDKPFDKKTIEPDFELFFNSLNEFVEAKYKEIEKLHSREDFRKDFLGNVSHELKTPLFTAQGYLLTVLDGSVGDSKVEKKYLERANKSIERLNFIIKDLDMITKLESGMKLNYETFNIIKLINDVFEMFEMQAQKKDITLTFDKIYDFPLLVKGDKERIEQVLINLISNSINYGKKNGSTILSVKSFSKKKFIINVKDDGLGIKEKYIPRLFERFYRVDKSRSREEGGSGLGLSIVKHIVEAHNQMVFVESKYKEGSTFSFTLNKVL